ncbi:MAG: ABC transporter ATP-binding protein [Rhodocyclaceae bacterium]|jgi:NitT/TauT family transport system ATP-binding protein|nr:ABC transporter ATP-binding protein [Rhodocyclaceae bacterium]
MNSKIEIREVTKRYHAGHVVEALKTIDLDIKEGEFVCLVGPSGCGKSTLLRMLAGLNLPSEGAINIHAKGGRSVPTSTVFQNYNVFPWKTIEANVRFGLRLAGIPRAEAAERSSKWLAKMGLAEFAKAYPPALSGGMLQRVAIARALAVDPEVLLLDEPFAALDPQTRRLMQEELLSLWQENRRTVVLVTHSLQEAILLGDRVVVMSARPGRIIADLKVPFERPRSPDIYHDPAFAALDQKIWGLLHDEVQRSFNGEKNQ